MDIIFATKNAGKMREIRAIMAETPFSVVSMEEAGIDIDVVEDGETFEENAAKKAVAVMQASGKPALSDDSGLEIDYLDKAPGVYSARYLGEDTPYPVKNAKILDMLKDVKDGDRTARFVCVIAAAFPSDENGYDVLTVRGELEGVISRQAKGESGFGYDPVFYVEEYKMTLAEIPAELKNKISHRAKALELMKEKLTGLV